MTDPFILTNCAVSVAIIVAIWFGPLASLRRDAFRTDIRQIRDELFDFMWKNGYSFENEAYRDTRQLLNGLLRMSNSLSPIPFLICIWHHLDDLENRPSFTNFDNCPNELRQALVRAINLAGSRMLRFMFAERSMWLFWKIVGLFRGTKRWLVLSKASWSAVSELFVDIYPLGAPPSKLTGSQRLVLGCRG